MQIRRVLGIAGAFLTLAIPYFLMLHNVNGHIESEQSLCPFKMLTGFPCPGCGITKSLIFFYEGDFLKSIQYHLFGPITVLFCIATIATLTVSLFTNKRYFENILFNMKLAYTLGIILATYHSIRLILFVYSHSIDDILRESIWR